MTNTILEKSDQPQTPQPPEFYVDSTILQIGPYGALLDFGLRRSTVEEDSLIPQVRIRMSIEHLWVVTKITDNLLQKYIDEVGPLPLPAGLVKELGLEEEYKRDMEADHD